MSRPGVIARRPPAGRSSRIRVQASASLFSMNAEEAQTRPASSWPVNRPRNRSPSRDCSTVRTVHSGGVSSFFRACHSPGSSQEASEAIHRFSEAVIGAGRFVFEVLDGEVPVADRRVRRDPVGPVGQVDVRRRRPFGEHQSAWCPLVDLVESLFAVPQHRGRLLGASRREERGKRGPAGTLSRQ
jgi:hypothetical protein